MKTSTFSLTAAAVLALGACGSDGSEQTTTKTVTESPSSADVEVADEDVQAEKEAETGNDLWADLDTYDDAYALGKAIGSDYWNHEDGGGSLDCTKVNQETAQERDEHKGGVVDVTVIDCERAGTLEQVQIIVAKGADEDEPSVPVCDPAFEGDTCFTGKGWTIDAESTGMLKEMLEAIDVDVEAWGIGEDVGY